MPVTTTKDDQCDTYYGADNRRHQDDRRQSLPTEPRPKCRKQFEDNGIQYLHLVDLDGAKAKHIVNYKTLERICSKTNLTIDFGGGLKSDEDLNIAFNSGASQITGGSIAANNPEVFITWLEKYGATKIILGAD